MPPGARTPAPRARTRRPRRPPAAAGSGSGRHPRPQPPSPACPARVADQVRPHAAGQDAQILRVKRVPIARPAASSARSSAPRRGCRGGGPAQADPRLRTSHGAISGHRGAMSCAARARSDAPDPRRRSRALVGAVRDAPPQPTAAGACALSSCPTTGSTRSRRSRCASRTVRTDRGQTALSSQSA